MSERAGADRRNYLANLLEGGLYLGATPFFSPQTVLPALVAGLGGGNLAVGAVAVLNHAAVFGPQAFVARHVAARRWKKPWALGFALALLAPSLVAFAPVFVLVGVNLGTEYMARHNMAAEFALEEQRAVFVGMMNTTLAPFCLSGLIGGIIADAFGYRAVFAIGVGLAALALTVLLLLVRDPRHAGRRRPSADTSAQP